MAVQFNSNFRGGQFELTWRIPSWGLSNVELSWRLIRTNVAGRCKHWNISLSFSIIIRFFRIFNDSSGRTLPDPCITELLLQNLWNTVILRYSGIFFLITTVFLFEQTWRLIRTFVAELSNLPEKCRTIVTPCSNFHDALRKCPDFRLLQL